LLKRPDKLTAIEAEEVEAMLKISERLRQAYVLKNEFYKVMDSKNSLRLKSNWPDGTCYSTVTISLNSMTVSGPLQTGKERY